MEQDRLGASSSPRPEVHTVSEAAAEAVAAVSAEDMPDLVTRT
jgi:hypothetical protein